MNLRASSDMQVGQAMEPTQVMQSFEHQWAVLLTTFRRDGTGVGTPVHLAVEDDHGYFRTSSRAYKVKRIRRNPTAQVAACSPSGKVTGPTFSCRVRVIEGAEAALAERVIKRKYPVVQGVVIELIKAMKHDHGAYFEVTPS